jgi:predicted nucleotidyltransferase
MPEHALLVETELEAGALVDSVVVANGVVVNEVNSEIGGVEVVLVDEEDDVKKVEGVKIEVVEVKEVELDRRRIL